MNSIFLEVSCPYLLVMSKARTCHDDGNWKISIDFGICFLLASSLLLISFWSTCNHRSATKRPHKVRKYHDRVLLSGTSTIFSNDIVELDALQKGWIDVINPLKRFDHIRHTDHLNNPITLSIGPFSDQLGQSIPVHEHIHIDTIVWESAGSLGSEIGVDIFSAEIAGTESSKMQMMKKLRSCVPRGWMRKWP